MFWLKRRRNSSPGATRLEKRARVIVTSDATDAADTMNTMSATEKMNMTDAENFEMAESDSNVSIEHEPDVGPPGNVITPNIRKVRNLLHLLWV